MTQPTVTSVDPSVGPTAGGEVVTITGTNLTGATAVTFGGVPGTIISVFSDTIIMVEAPPVSMTGTVDVTVTTPGGTSATSPADQFTYLGVPTVISLSPSSGPSSGGTLVTITGNNFIDLGSQPVLFGSSAATSFTLISPTEITAISPTGSPGTTVDVTVTTPGGTSSSSFHDFFRYQPTVPPIITHVSPDFGATAGGGTVTITGSNFTQAFNVFFGPNAAAFIVVSDTQIIATVPPGSPGAVDVTVLNLLGGESATSAADEFTYYGFTTVTSVRPSAGSTAGGTSVTVTGTNFTGATAVQFGGFNAPKFSVNSSTQIIVTSPPGSAGTVDLTVTTPGGTSATSCGDDYTYLPWTLGAQILPNLGSTTGASEKTHVQATRPDLSRPHQNGCPPPDTGYWEIASDGGLFSFGDADFFGSMGGQPLNSPIVGMAPTPDGQGYWMPALDGGIFAFGDAGFFGSMGGQPLDAPIVGMAPTPDGQGYWLSGSDGGIFSFGDAQFFGSMGGKPLDKPIVGMAPTPDGLGYWEIASDGGLFSFGDADFFGSMGGQPLNSPIVGMAPTPDGQGYWLAAADGGIFSFGDAQFFGSTGGQPLNKPIVGMVPTSDGGGYFLVASDGGVFSYGNAPFSGSLGSQVLDGPVVGIADVNANSRTAPP